jgi:hypothetical protein
MKEGTKKPRPKGRGVVTNRTQHIVEQLESWERGYISPSAQMVMKDAKELIREQEQIIMDLQQEIAALTSKKKSKST